MSSSSSRIANLKHVANKIHNRGRVSNKFKKPLGNLSAYGIRTDTFYSQPLVEECCKEKEVEIELPKSYGNLILKISPATVNDKEKNPDIRSSLGIQVPVYEDDSEEKKNAIKTPYTNTFNIESPNTIYYVRLGYATFFTSVFSNLQIYLKPSKYKYVFKYLNYAIFIIFRYQFNKAIWNFRNFNILFSYYNNDLTKIYVSYSCMFIISLFNVLWTYIMLRNIHRKLIKSQ